MLSTNYASLNEGAKLVDFSSELEGCDAAHILDPHLPNIWLSEEGLPQWLCISLDGIKEKRDLVIRTIGWHCWHPYTTNPKEVTIHVSSDGAKFKIWDTFVAQQVKGTQLFCCAPINASIYPYIALEVIQTFGGMQTYMNRVFLYSEEIPSSPQGQTAAPDNSRSIYSSPSGHASRNPIAQGAHGHQDPRLPRSSIDSLHSADTPTVAHRLDQALGLSPHRPMHENHGRRYEDGTRLVNDSSFFSLRDDFHTSAIAAAAHVENRESGSLFHTSLEMRLAMLEKAAGVAVSGKSAQPPIASSAAGVSAGLTEHLLTLPSAQRIEQLERRMTAVLDTLESLRLSDSRPRYDLRRDGSENESIRDNDEVSDDASLSSSSTMHAPIAPVLQEDDDDEQRKWTKRKSGGKYDSSRFARALESIEGLVSSVLQRVESRHSHAVLAAATRNCDVSHLNLIASSALPDAPICDIGAGSDIKTASLPFPRPDIDALRTEYLQRANLQTHVSSAEELPREKVTTQEKPVDLSQAQGRTIPSSKDALVTKIDFHSDPELSEIVAKLQDAVLRRAYREAQLQLLMGGVSGNHGSKFANGGNVHDPMNLTYRTHQQTHRARMHGIDREHAAHQRASASGYSTFPSAKYPSSNPPLTHISRDVSSLNRNVVANTTTNRGRERQRSRGSDALDRCSSIDRLLVSRSLTDGVHYSASVPRFAQSTASAVSRRNMGGNVASSSRANASRGRMK